MFIIYLKVENSEANKPIIPGCRLKITLRYRSSKQLNHPQFLIKIRDFGTNANILRLDSDMISGLPEVLPPEGSISCITDNIYITPGRCTIDVEVKKGLITSDRVLSAGSFDVEAHDVYGSGKIPRRNQATYLIKYDFVLEE